MFQQVGEFSTTGGRESDVFYRMSKSAQQSIAYAFVVERLPIEKAIQSPHPDHWQMAAETAGKGLSKASRGCLVLAIMAVTGVFVIAFFGL